MKKIKLILENGEVFEGFSIGKLPTLEDCCMGEVVFNTSMSGYQEILSDPSYCDQIITLTYPLIGNYGISREDFESLRPALKAIVFSEACQYPNHWRSQNSIAETLNNLGIVGITQIDTRKLTKIIRNHGTLKGLICPQDTSLDKAKELLSLKIPTDVVARVSSLRSSHYPGNGPRIVMIDFGFKKNILHSLLKRNCDVIIVPYDTSAEKIHHFYPDGIVLSNGPGDPKVLTEVIPVIQELQKNYPLFAICMGHQLFALANGAQTEKMKFGHRGANQPVLDILKDKIYLTSQNHGYTVNTASIATTDLEITQVNLNDGSCEGLKHKYLPAFSVQYHPEGSPGPEDTAWLFDDFIKLISKENKYAHR